MLTQTKETSVDEDNESSQTMRHVSEWTINSVSALCSRSFPTWNSLLFDLTFPKPADVTLSGPQCLHYLLNQDHDTFLL